MRWLKHLTAAHKDEEVDLLLEECGAVAYGAYWLILEDIAGPMENEKMVAEAVHSDQKWAQIAHVHHRVWRSLKEKLGHKLLNISPTGDDRVRIAAPNIMKYKDEYSRKSGHSPALSRGRADTDREQRESRGRAEQNPEPAPAAETAAALPPDLEKLAGSACQRMHEKHPYPSNPLDAAYQFQKIVSTAVSPVAVIESSERNHAAWCEYWLKLTSDTGRAPWVPKLAEFFGNGYHAKLPPARDGPAPQKPIAKSKQERDSDAAQAQFDKLARERSARSGPTVHANR